jgi:hypothetical protein
VRRLFARTRLLPRVQDARALIVAHGTKRSLAITKLSCNLDRAGRSLNKVPVH